MNARNRSLGFLGLSSPASLMLAGTLTLAGAAGAAQAATITAISAANKPTVVDTIPVAGTGSSGYYVYGMLSADAATAAASHPYVNVLDLQAAGNATAAGIDDLPSWATVSFSNAANAYVHTTDSTLTVNGTAYTTVEDFSSITITLGTGAPTDFTLGVLADNSDDGTFNLTASTSGSATSTATIPDETYITDKNDFYYFSVTGAASGDTIQIRTGLADDSRAGGGIGGFTLDAAAGSAVPEPASLALLAVGAAGLLRRRRRTA